MQILHAFAQSDVLHRNLELVGDADNHASLGRAVQLGDCHGRDFRGQGELFGLLESILSRRAVQYQQDFVRSVGHHFLHHVLYLGQLVHQADFVVQASGGIYDDHIRMVGHRRAQRVKSHRCRIRPHLLLHDRHPYTLAPNHQLLHSRRPEGICRPQVNGFPGFLELVGQLADGRGLSHSIDAYHHDYVGLLSGRYVEIVRIHRVVFGKQGGDFIAQNPVQFLRVHVFVRRDALLDALYDFQRCLHAYIGSN